MRALLYRLSWLALGALAALLVLECIFRLLPVSLWTFRTGQMERWPLQGYEARRPYTYSRTWEMLNIHHGTTNNYGHIAPFEYRAGSHPVIALGDSYVESLMNAYEDTMQGQLGERLGSRESVYGLGFSGLSAADYLAISRLAGAELAPRAVVIVIFNGDLSESLLARQGYYHFEPQGYTFRLVYRPLDDDQSTRELRRMVRGSSLYRYVFGNLGFSFDSVFKLGRTEQAPRPLAAGGEADSQRRVIDYFLAELPRATGVSPQCIAFLVDSDRYAIYNPKLASVPNEQPEVRHYFLERAQKLGFAVSDLDPVFRARYARDRAKFDYWPSDRHWNRLGHGVAAEEAYRLLFGQGRRECLPGTIGPRTNARINPAATASERR
ncbi:MAG TPA: hypothetical protein VKF40_16160 [Burkholderiales bacterium]|nr:hypothetical protein [Burkholderiales bacterium]